MPLLTTDDQIEIEQARIEALRRNVKDSTRELAKAEERLRRLREPSIDEPTRAKSIVRFSLKMEMFGGGRSTYDYAAIRTGNRWYTTGSTCPKDGYSWNQLWAFIRKHDLVEFVVVDGAAVPF